MKPQVIVTPNGERLILLPEADYAVLVEAAEDSADRVAVQTYRQKLAAGDEELVPSEIVDRLLSGESRVRVWREHRGIAAAALAESAGIGQSHLSHIETGKQAGSIDTLRKLADALSLTVDDLVG